MLATAACSKHSAIGLSVRSDFRAYIPPDTKALAGLDLDSVKASPFYKRHQSELNLPLLDAMSERVGLDPRRDISYLLVAWNGTHPLAIARGRFQTGSLEQKLGSLGLARTRYKSYNLFGDGKDALTVAKHGILIAGPVDTVRSELDLVNGAIPDELEQRLGTLSKADQIWIVSRGGLAFPDLPMRSDIDSALSNITGVISGASLGIALDSGARLQLEISCLSEQGAQRVRDALRGGIGLARLTTKDNESDLLQAYDAIQVNQDQQTVRVNADLTAELSDKLLGHLSGLRERAGEMLNQR
jgi:ribosomal protein S13